jgi:hypothetical protein
MHIANNKTISRCLAPVVLLLLLIAVRPLYAKEVIGWLEYVTIQPGDLQLKAKIDTGAKISSLSCDCHEVIEKGDEKYIRFTITNNSGKQLLLERKIVRIAKLKRHFGESQKRIVITLGICLGNIYKEAEVNVIDRTGFNYPMLIGRNFLAGEFLIDTEAKYKSTPVCKQTLRSKE